VRTTAGAPEANRIVGPTVPVLVFVLVILVFASGRPAGELYVLFGLVLAGVAAGVALRALRSPAAHDAAPVPVLAGLGIVAAVSPVQPVVELLVGLSGVLFVAWLMDDPSRPPAAVVRGAVGWTILGMAVAIAWASSFLLPSNAAPLGVAGGLLAVILLVLAYLVRRRDLLDQDLAATI
jgi:hypothetical protein